MTTVSRRITRLSAAKLEVADSQNGDSESDANESELSEPDYEDDEISVPPTSAKGKGKAKHRTLKSNDKTSTRTPRTVNKGKGKASRAPSVALSIATVEDDALTDPLEVADDDSGSEFTDQDESEAEEDVFADAGGFLPEETEDVEDAGPSRAAPVRRQRAARQPRARRVFPRRTRVSPLILRLIGIVALTNQIGREYPLSTLPATS